MLIFYNQFYFLQKFPIIAYDHIIYYYILLKQS